MLTVYVKTLCN